MVQVRHQLPVLAITPTMPPKQPRPQMAAQLLQFLQPQCPNLVPAKLMLQYCPPHNRTLHYIWENMQPPGLQLNRATDIYTGCASELCKHRSLTYVSTPLPWGKTPSAERIRIHLKGTEPIQALGASTLATWELT